MCYNHLMKVEKVYKNAEYFDKCNCNRITDCGLLHQYIQHFGSQRDIYNSADYSPYYNYSGFQDFG